MLDFRDCGVLVLGDVMLDRFLYGDVHRVSPEAPVPVVRLRRRNSMPGGAGNVARNIAALGGRAVLVGLVGEDEAAAELRSLLAETPGIADALVSNPARRTTSKVRVIAAQQQMLRLDEEMAAPAEAGERDGMRSAIAAGLAGCRAMILSDYAKGTLSPGVIADSIAIANAQGVPVFADPKSEDMARYRGTRCVTPNARELALAARMPTDTEADVVAAARTVLERDGLQALLCTRAEKGMILVEATGGVQSVPAVAREVFDVSGAGDTVIGTLALANAAGIPLAESVRIANTAAGIVVGKLGTATVTATELDYVLHSQGSDAPGEIAGGSLLDSEAARRLVSEWRAHGLRVGLTNGCFDILHAGHVALLQAARRRCDRLIVALNSDASVRRLKGAPRPINTLGDRAAVIAALAAVDAVVAFEEDTPLRLITALAPDVLVKGGDYTEDRVVGADLVRRAGGEVVLVDLLAGRSTTSIIRRAGQDGALS